MDRLADADGMLLNPHYCSRSFDDLPKDAVVEPACLPRRSTVLDVAEWDRNYLVHQPTALLEQDEGMGRSIELRDASAASLAVVDRISQQCEYYHPELRPDEAAACLKYGYVGSFLVHSVAADEEDENAIFALSFKDEDESIIQKVSNYRVVMRERFALACVYPSCRTSM